MMVEQSEINSILDELLSISESEGALILSSDGSIIGSKLKNDFIKSKLVKYFSELMATVISITSKVNFGEPEQIFVQGTERKIFVHEVKEKNVYVILLGTSDMNTGFASIAIEKIIPTLKRIVQ